MSRGDSQLNLRIPSGMRERIRDRAAANRRSMNSEIVHYLDRALAAEENEGPVETAISPSPDHPTHPLGKEQQR